MILKTIRHFALASFFAFMLGCASVVHPGYLPISDGGNTRQYPWFTIQVPEGEGWYQMSQHDHAVYFGKDTKRELTRPLKLKPVESRVSGW